MPAKKAERIFDLITEFAGYGFNKSHSCAYALLAYQTAWLKTHYPVEFMAALLTSETGNTEKVVKYIHEARGMGITVLPPDVNSSELDFTPVGEEIRFGMRAIKNVGENTVRGILEARERLGLFRSIFQFCEAVDTRLLNRRVHREPDQVRRHGFAGRRPRATVRGDRPRHGARAEIPARAHQRPARSVPGRRRSSRSCPNRRLPDVEEWPEHELLAAEFATLGFYVSGHPLAKHAARLKEIGAVELATIEGRRNGEEVTVAGMVMSMRPMRSRKGDRWAILSLQDMTGGLEALVISGSVRAPGEQAEIGRAALVLKGRVNVEEAGTRLVDSGRPAAGPRRPERLGRDARSRGPGFDGRVHARSLEGTLRALAGSLPDRFRPARPGRLGGHAALAAARAVRMRNCSLPCAKCAARTPSRL